VTRLLLVRHATSVPPTPSGPDEYHRPLADVGRRQADALVEVLKPESPVRFLSSPFLRAVQTLAPTAAALGLAVETRDVLREWRSGIAATPAWEAHYRHCWERPDWALPGGETHHALEERAVSALQQIAAEGPSDAVTIVGSHGTWITRALHGLGCEVDVEFWLDMPMPAVFEVVLNGHSATVTGPGLGGR
jgi:2,3-bisphosphoglycerate-dependent phosphoglycerate mutase